MYRVVFIDGRSGSGKTMLAERLAGEVAEVTGGSSAQILHLDDLYPGWGGLTAGSEAVARVLRQGHYRPYDWEGGDYRGRRVTIDPSRPLIIEGCGSLTAANLAAAREWASDGMVRTIWLDCDEGVRHERAIARDGDLFAAHWDEWAAQEDVHFALHEPWKLAGEVLASG